MNIKFSVVGITETWLQDPPLGVNIDGYNFVYKNRRVRSGGGVGLYLSDNLDYRIRTDIYADEDEVMESLFIEIIRPHERNVIVGLIYRPPSQNVKFNDFVTRMNDVLEKISRDNKTCYLMGDFNLNLLNNENHNTTGEFLDGPAKLLGSSHKIGHSLPSFFSETGLEKFPRNPSFFSVNLSLKIPRNLTFFSAT